MLFTRLPSPSLSPFVRRLWAIDTTGAPHPSLRARERVLPTGEMHLVFRLTDHPLRLFSAADDRTGRIIGHTIVGGVASTYYLRDVSLPVQSVGVQLHPAACELLFGVPAAELAGRHVSLDSFWGASAEEARDRLQQRSNLEDKTTILESILAGRLPRMRGLHPAVAHALRRFEVSASVGQVVQESGWSHRQFIELFRQAMGMTPKAYSRLMRFQGAVRKLTADPKAPASGVALDAGYSDQPHLNREFLEFAGVTPGEYRALSPARTHHVPIRSR